MLRRFRESPVLLLFVVALAALAILLLRDLDFGHLQTDVIIMRAWMREVGVEGFTQRYLDVNQRHLLVGPLYTLAYQLFGENNLPYNVIFVGSRLLQGVFLGGIVFELTRRRLLAISAGLALMFTIIRLPELFQGINWYIEPTLTLLLASSYVYLLSLREGRFRAGRYALAVALYVISSLIYEAGMPWIAVNALLGYLRREGSPSRKRLWLAIRDALLPLGFAVVLALLILFVFEPWSTLQPDVSASLGRRLVDSASTLLTFPLQYVNMALVTLRDGYALPMVLCAVVAAISVWLSGRGSTAVHEDPKRDYARLWLVALAMFAASLLVGVSSGGISPTYLDRITFGRAAGISLFWVTLVFAVFDVVRIGEKGAAVAVAVIFAGGGFAWMLTYQDYAHAAFREIDRIERGILALRPMIYSPVHFVVVTDDDWVGARFVDASDVIVHEVQQRLWADGADATLDILHTAAYPEEYATLPGTCDTVSGEYSAGMCFDAETVHTSRWAFGTTHPLEDLVLVRYDDDAGQFSVVDRLTMDELGAYNIVSVGATQLQTNPARLAVPLPIEVGG